jgi:hypothetical protein
MYGNRIPSPMRSFGDQSHSENARIFRYYLTNRAISLDHHDNNGISMTRITFSQPLPESGGNRRSSSARYRKWGPRDGFPDVFVDRSELTHFSFVTVNSRSRGEAGVIVDCDPARTGYSTIPIDGASPDAHIGMNRPSPPSGAPYFEYRPIAIQSINFRATVT